MQKKAITCSATSSLSLASQKTDIPWSAYEYQNHQISFSDLGSITASVRVYPAEASGAFYYVDATTYTGTNKHKKFSFSDYGVVGFVVLFDAPFTGTVYFGSYEPTVKVE